MFGPIVVGTDGSATASAAVRKAAALAQALSCDLHIVSAFRSASSTLAAMGPEGADIAGLAQGADIEIKADVEIMLDDLQAQLVASGVKVSTHAVGRDPAATLVEVAKTQGAGLIVVGNKGMQGAKRMLGSVPNSVSHHAPCDVLIVRTT